MHVLSKVTHLSMIVALWGFNVSLLQLNKRKRNSCSPSYRSSSTTGLQCVGLDSVGQPLSQPLSMDVLIDDGI